MFICLEAWRTIAFGGMTPFHVLKKGAMAGMKIGTHGNHAKSLVSKNILEHLPFYIIELDILPAEVLKAVTLRGSLVQVQLML